MKLSPFSIKELSTLICGDKEGWPYRTGQDLVDFFNSHGCRDVYGPGFPTRKVFAKDKIDFLNKRGKLKDIFKDLLDPRVWQNMSLTVDVAAQYINTIIQADGYEVVRDQQIFKVRDISGALIDVENRFDDSSQINDLMIEEQIKKCRDKIDTGDYSGAITNARSLVESVCLKIESELDINAPPSHDGDLNKLFNRVRKLLNMDPSRPDISGSVKQVLSGLSNITHGLATMRNKMSDSHAVNYQPSRHHAKLAVNSAKTLSDFLFDSMNFQIEKGIIKKLTS